MPCGIYAITHTESNRLYVGSAVNIAARWKDHRVKLNRGEHENGYLQNAWAKYGEAAFLFSIIELTEPDKLIEREQYWMDYHKSYERDKGFNICANAGNLSGFKHSDEFKKIIAESNSRRTRNAESRARMSEIMKGNKNGRNAKGPRRFADEEVKTILARHADGEKLKDLAVEYRVHYITLSRIKNKHTKQSRELHESGQLR